MDEPTFSAADAVKAQQALRAALGLGPQRFPLAAFVGMISDEIEELRAAGWSDADIADTAGRAIGRVIAPDDLREHYASPEARGRR